MRAPGIPHVAVATCVFYISVAVVLTWPLAAVIGSRVPHDLGDPLLSIWALWWNSERIPFTADWWNAPQFYPVQGSAAFSDHRVGSILISHPVLLAGGSPLAAYNLTLLLTFPLSAIAAHWLVFALTRRHDAALISGLAFGFNPYRAAHIEHLELLCSYWMPVALLALHRYVERPAVRWLAFFGAAWTLQALCSSYYLFYFSVFVALWLLWFIRLDLARRHVAALAGTWAAAGVCLLPVLLRYRQIHESLGLDRPLREVEHFSADMTAVLSASPLLAFWRSSPVFDQPEGQLFPGACVLALVLAALCVARVRVPAARTGLERIALGLSGFFGVIALTPVLWRPWKLFFAGFRVSVTSSRKPLSVAAAWLVVYCLLHPRVRSAYRRRSPFAFYVIAGAVLWVLSWGPSPEFLGRRILYEAPYAWLMRLPGFDSGLRVPARFAMPAILALSVAAGLAFGRLVPARHRMRMPVLALMAAGVVADGWIGDLPFLRPPSNWNAPVHRDAFSAVLELPVVPGAESDAAAVFRGLFHGRPTVNGFSGHYPPHYVPMRLGLDAGDEGVLPALAASGPLLVAIDRRNDPAGDWVRFVSGHSQAVPAGTTGTWSFFLVPVSEEGRAARMRGHPIAIQGVTSNFSTEDARHLLDNDPLTRWFTPGPQRGTEEVAIDLGGPRHVTGVVVSLGPYKADFPRRLAIETSLNGELWTSRWEGPTAGRTVAAVLEDPHHANLAFPFTENGARFVRLRSIHPDPVYHWTVARVAVFGE
jgi:hypothetical protein